MNGRDRARTDDPYRVEVVLCQLSYAPFKGVLGFYGLVINGVNRGEV